jgi:hypothetical protein
VKYPVRAVDIDAVRIFAFLNLSGSRSIPEIMALSDSAENGNQNHPVNEARGGLNEEGLAHPVIVTTITIPIALNSGQYLTGNR